MRTATAGGTGVVGGRVLHTESSNLIATVERARLGHLTILLIVGIDRMPHGYYAGKVAEEDIIQASYALDDPSATQFHEFATSP